MRCGYIVKINPKAIRPHINADRLDCVEIFGCNVIIQKNLDTSKLYVYFPTDLQFGEEFATENNLLRKKDENGKEIGGYLDPDKRYLRPLKLRGEISDGLLLPLESLSKFTDISTLQEGDTISTLNGKEICCKYIPKRNPQRQRNSTDKKNQKKGKIEDDIIFPVHIDTEQLKYNLMKFRAGDHVTITEKLEGTSHRSALLPVRKTSWFRKLFKLGDKVTYKSFCGSRRVTISSVEGGYYGSNDFRMDIHRKLAPHLSPNMEVFGEIVGWSGPNTTPLMGTVDTTCLNDKEFTKKYGKQMVFNYGLNEGEYDFYVYRICILDEDGNVLIEYSTDQIVAWCEDHGFKHVPILYRGYITGEEDIKDLARTFNDGNSTLGNHWREGCVIRRDNNARKYEVYKDKNDYYKIMKGMAVDKISENTELSQDILEEM